MWGIVGVVMERKATGLREEDNKNRGGSRGVASMVYDVKCVSLDYLITLTTLSP